MSFKVTVANTDLEFVVENGEKILDAAIRQGITMPYGCRRGICGKCAGELISGEIEYDDILKGTALVEHKQGKTLFCQARATTGLEIKVRNDRKTKGIQVKILPCRVERMELLAHDVMKVELKIPETEDLEFLAGQYIEFLLKDDKRRAFSIANAPHNSEYIELHIRHVPDGQFGDYVFDGMKEKTLLKIEGPLGSYYLREESPRPAILIGGGTGFAPLKGMLEHAFHIGYEKPLHLFCGVRAKRDLYMDDLVKQWIKKYPNLKYTAVLSEPEESDNWQGLTGFIHEVVVEHYPDMSNYDVYMSGPPPMIKAGMDVFYKHGLPESQIFSDSFEYSDDALKAMGIQKPKS